MNILDYLTSYQDISFKQSPFNELDALALTSLSYFPFDKLAKKKDVLNTKQMKKLLAIYQIPEGTSERHYNYYRILITLLTSKRYAKAKYGYYRKQKDKAEEKQFQAVTIILPKLVFLSFGGTDGTLTGWKEDFNMAYLDIVPAEVEAIKYAEMVAKKFFIRKFMFGGHSKGGRIALTAAKHFYKKKKLVTIYTYDAPNYPNSFYDDTYRLISHKIHAYVPPESIIGRLMIMDEEKTIIASDKTLLYQHDFLNWLIEDNAFIKEELYSDRSTRIVEFINEVFLSYDNHYKQVFVDALFNLLEKLLNENLPNDNEFVSYFKSKFSLIVKSWKDTPKEGREAMRKVLFSIGKEYLKYKLKK